MSEAFYVSAFFDRPQLLAVRLISAGGVGATFAQLRRPDVASGIGAFAPYLAVGLLGLVGTAFALSTCSPDTPKQGNLRPTIGNTVTTDVAGGQDWASHLANLADDCGPQRNDLTP